MYADFIIALHFFEEIYQKGRPGHYSPDSGSLVSDVKHLMGSYREELLEVLMWATVEVTWMWFSPGR